MNSVIMYSIFNIKKKSNNSSKQDEEQNQTYNINNEDGELKSSNNIFKSTFEKHQLQNYYRNRRYHHH